MKFNDFKPMGSTISVPEASGMLNVHPNTVFKLIESGELPAAKIGRAYVMLYKDVMNYVEGLVIKQTSERQTGGPAVKRKYRRRSSPQLVGQV